MRIRSLRVKILALLALLAVPVFFIVFNLYLERHQEHHVHTRYNLESSERGILKLVVDETNILSGGTETKDLQKDYLDIAQRLQPHAPEISLWLQNRVKLFQDLAEHARRSKLLFQKTEARLLNLTNSVRYIHEHHMVYLKNFMRRGRMEQDYGTVDDFVRSDEASASEVDIVRAAVEIHNTVLDLLRFFQEIRQNPLLEDAEQLFKKRIHSFFASVNEFEDFSLDAQDGLLVEELLINGQIFEQDFAVAMSSGAQTALLSKQLSDNLTTVLSGISQRRTHSQSQYRQNREWILGVQVASVILSFLAVIGIAINAIGLFKRLRGIVRETGEIQDNLSHRIPIGDRVPEEFAVVFGALNNMASRIQNQVIELEKSRSVLGQRVEERTRELEEVNQSLRQEVLEREQVAAALKNSEQLYRGLFENTTDIIQSVDSTLQFILANPAWHKRLGYDVKAISDLNLFDVVPSEQQALWKKNIDLLTMGGAAVRIEGSMLNSDNQEVSVEGVATKSEDSGKTFYHFFLRDTSAQKQAESDRLRIEKLDSLGILAGGIAHDFNNLLAALVGNLTLAARECPTEGKMRTRIEKAEEAAHRAADLTRQLLTFSKGGEPIRELADLKETIRDSTQFVLSGSNVRCEFNLTNDLWPAKVDRGQLSQVLQNLVINADHAMSSGGVLEVLARNILPEETIGLPESGYPHVCISIIDNGSGIAEAELERIFDPYYTTKSRGSGLGLASAHSIVRKHDGWINVSSTLGKGTRFDIYLPAEPGMDVTSTHNSTDFTTLRGGRVLVMDDEASVREIISDILHANGCDVVPTENGQEALTAFMEASKEGAPFDIVITDLTVPGGMGGEELATQLRKLNPHVPIMISSGYANDPIMGNYERLGFSGVLTKPFRANTLISAVSKALAKPPSPAPSSKIVPDSGTGVT